MKVKNTAEAWEIANRIFQTDYTKDETSSARAGYPVYRSGINHYDYICDLGDRLEINLHNGETLNIWIESENEKADENEMTEYALTVGLFDKDSEKQEIYSDVAKDIISRILIDDFQIFAYTMIDCYGVYRMQSTGRIVREPSIRIEIVTDSDESEKMKSIIERLKRQLNQESIMFKTTRANIEFR